MIKTWHYIKEFSDALELQLREDDKRWGDTWLQRMPQGQEARIEEHIVGYFDQFRNVGTEIPWLKIGGLALIAWIRENKPEIWNK